jgi:hypothetical protein
VNKLRNLEMPITIAPRNEVFREGEVLSALRGEPGMTSRTSN